MKKETTPLLEQYWKIKNQHKDAIVFFRLGDFYEMFGEDATEAAPILDLALTARFKNTPNEIPMAGIPHHAAENYIAGLTKAGKKVAIADQTSPAGQGKIVDRAVVRIITPGTTFSDNILQGNSNNYCASFAPTKDAFGIAFCDITTGDFFVTTVPTQSTAHTLLKRLDPAEILTHEEIAQAPPQEIADLPLINAPMLTLDAESLLTDHFNIHSLDSFGMDPENPHTIAAARLLQYLKDTQKTELSHLTHIQQYQWQSSMLLDETTIRNLELFYTQRTHAIKGSLLDVIDTTQTPMGGRLIRQWLLHPLLDEKEIEGRLNAVEECVNTPLFKQTLEPLLKKISDIERIAGKIGTARVTPRDLYHHRETLAILPEISKTFSSAKSTNFKSIKQSLQKKEWEELETLLTKELSEDPPVMIDSGNVMKDGFHKELDELRKIATGGKEWLAQYQEEQRKETGIEKLKIKFNRVFGYFIEVTKSRAEDVPETYERRQTLVNAERFITPKLKEYEEKVLTAEETILSIEKNLFEELTQKCIPHLPTIKKIANAISEIDVLLSFAKNAIELQYNKPTITKDSEINITHGRHPVIEKSLKTPYVPNNTNLNSQDHQIIILTGPNMSGKSSYLRQTALIVLMAQIGSFVPAHKATIGVVDRIFTRVGATDDLSRGQSTFMVEMQEAAHILHNATDSSLIIFDELGRGTSTYDGVAIAWAILSHLHEHSRTKTLFATHYHELIELGETLDRCQNYRVMVKENEKEGVIFLHTVEPGGIDRSYGVEVAKLAGMPAPIIDSAKEKLGTLENGSAPPKQIEDESNQPTLFSTCQHEGLVTKIQTTDPNSMTPIQALQFLEELKKHT